MPEFQLIPLSQIRESKHNPRTHFDAKGLEELAQSIRTHGVVTPTLVRPSNGHFELAAGHRRFRAAKIAGVDKLPAVVRDMSDVQMLEILTIENLQREDVHPLEEATGYKNLIASGYDVEKLAERVGRSVKYVYDRMKLLSLCEEGRTLFFDGKITAGHAILLSRLKPADQKRGLGLKNGKPAFGPTFTVEGGDSDEAREDRLKTVSVRELDGWIARHVRFDPTKDADPMLFPTAAANLERAEEVAETIVPITRQHQLTDDHVRTKERVFTVVSWKRADGEVEPTWYGKAMKSKTCASSVLGVVVVGPGRGETFRVCVEKKKCAIHWGAEIRERPKRANGGDSTGQKERDQYAARLKRDQAEQQRQDAAKRSWEKAAPAILEALIEKVSAAKGLGQVADLVLRTCAARYGVPKKAIETIAAGTSGKSAEAILKRAALQVLASDVFDSWRGPREIPKRARAFGVDVAKILKAQGPQTSAKGGA